ncbi:MAG: nuclear transport factor 2 family protein, partial [Phycisphaerales bacterium]|nr:nuclear transport factor 2 family protein [Phycisphaerales bacterium]
MADPSFDRPTTVWSVLQAFARRNKSLVIFATGLNLVLLTGIVIASIAASRMQREADRLRAALADPAPARVTRGVSEEAVTLVLDELHDAASKADGKRYFALFAPDAVFLGTDATERWPIGEFRRYAQARFDTGTGWTYMLVKDKRFISVSQDGSIAWFDELLQNAKYGVCRGTGVLRRVDG